jgi:hypothetical protein
MKRLHIHVGVERLDQSITFYSALFGAQPAKIKEDYAKWMLEDPRINFAISTLSGKAGIDHLGLQVDEPDELEVMRERFKRADLSLSEEGETVCCYARSDKSWVEDPAGVAWETYHTMEDVPLFSSGARGEAAAVTATQAIDPVAGLSPAENNAGCCG